MTISFSSGDSAHLWRIAWLVLVSIVANDRISPIVWGGDRVLAAASGISTDNRFEQVNSTSDAFQRLAQAESDTIPRPVGELLAQAGWRFQLSEFLVDAVPALKHEHPRGWPTWMTWQNVDGVYLPRDQVLVFAEKRRNKKGDVVACTRLGGVMRHEIGHAFDMLAGGSGRHFSSRPEFQNAYQRDIKHMPRATSDTLVYYLQNASAGRQEAFAEAFAIALGGGSDEANGQLFEGSFPAVMKRSLVISASTWRRTPNETR